MLIRVKAVLGVALVVLCLAWVLDVHSYLGLTLFTEQFLALGLALGLALVFLSKPLSGVRAGMPDFAAALIAFGVLLYVAVNYERLIRTFAGQGADVVAIGAVLVLLVLEAARRAAGWFLFAFIVCMLAYAMSGHLVPAPLTARQVSVSHLLVYLGFDPSAVLGSLLKVTATVVLPFILLGQLLIKAGGGEFFLDLATATVRNRRAGAAKISVVASALFGSVSGSAVSNVATTGIITIPLMQRSGLSAVQASAVEVSASTGGQLMPPIMGAAAFLMAEFLELPYTQVVVAGILPAFLYYLSIFMQVHTMTGDRQIAMESDPVERRALRVIADGWHFVATLLVLVVVMFGSSVEPESAAIYASGAMLATGALRRYRGCRLDPLSIIKAVAAAGASIAELIVLVAAAGIIVGVLNATAGGFALTLLLVQLAGTGMLNVLLLAAFLCILFGMGMPTTGVYVLLSVLVAPAMVDVGVQPLAAHYFILYMGMMSMITPPLGLATFPAALISGANATRIGLRAARMSWVAYVVPFLFVLSPTLIMHGMTGSIVTDTVSAVCGIILLSRAALTADPGPLNRAALAILGVLALLPEVVLPYGRVATLSASVAGIGMLYHIRRSSAGAGALRG